MTTLAAPDRLAPQRRARIEQLRERLYPPMPADRWTSWIWTGLVAVLAGVLRFRSLATPHGLVFDEVYYVHDAESLLKHGVERGPTFSEPAFIVHPPLGKWMIAAGEWLFGGGDQTIKGVIYPSDVNGWRFSAAVVGTLAVLIVARAVRRMTRSTLLGCVAGLLLTLDSLAFVQSRIATLDIFLMFWVTAAFGCLVADRDWGRRRLVERAERAEASFMVDRRIGFRPWRLLTMVCLGAAVATKWDGLFYVVLFGVLMFCWDISARRAAGDPREYRPLTLWQRIRTRTHGAPYEPRRGVPFWHWVRQATRYDVLPLVGALLLVPVVYTASWSGWFATSGGYDRNWAKTHQSHWQLGPMKLPGIGSHAPDAIRSWVHYQDDMLRFHNGLHPTKQNPKNGHHPYQSHSWGWLALARPVSYYYGAPRTGERQDGQTCHAPRTLDPTNGQLNPGYCSQEVLGIGSPAIWWAMFPALAFLFLVWIGRRDWRAGLAFLGVVVPLVGWIPSDLQGRTMFLFYALPAVPFMAVGLSLCIGYAIGSRDGPPIRRLIASSATGVYLLLVLINFMLFYPALAARVIPYHQWHDSIIWFPSWI